MTRNRRFIVTGVIWAGLMPTVLIAAAESWHALAAVHYYGAPLVFFSITSNTSINVSRL